MSLCYDFQKWTVLSLGLIAATLIIGLVLMQVGHGQTDNSNNTKSEKEVEVPYRSNFTIKENIDKLTNENIDMANALAAVLNSCKDWFENGDYSMVAECEQITKSYNQHLKEFQNDTKDIRLKIISKRLNLN